MAQAIVNKDYSDQFEAFSAGSHPKAIDQRTFNTLESRGYPTQNIQPKSIELFQEQEFDYLITLCTAARGECTSVPGISETLSWDISQPKLVAMNDTFEPTFEELKKRIHLFSILQSAPLEDQFDAMQFHKSLGEKTRLMITSLLHIEEELSVGELSEALQEVQPKVSRALAQLKEMKLVQDRRQGVWMFYSIANDLPQWARSILDQTVMAKHIQLKSALLLLNTTSRPQIDHSKKVEK